MRYEDDPDAYRLALEVKLAPERVRDTLSFAGLYQITHELIKNAVLDDVKNFYKLDFSGPMPAVDEAAYRREVLSKAPKDRFRASLIWLVEAGAITLQQADRLEEIRQHRNALTHELVRFVIDPEFEPNHDLFIDALMILKAIRRFWTSINRDMGMFEHLDDVHLDEITPLSLMVLQTCIDAYLDGPLRG